MNWKPWLERSGIKKRASRNKELGRQAKVKLVKNDKCPRVRPGTLLKRKDEPIEADRGVIGDVRGFAVGTNYNKPAE
jgi:hypothetical protein